MRQIIPQSILDRTFRGAVTIKGIDGALEMLGGATLIAIPLSKIRGWLGDLAIREIAEDKHAFIANFVLALDHNIDPHAQMFAVIYLLGHGGIKVFLAIALLRQHYRVYPVAIAFLLAFIFYQSYRIGYDRSVGLMVLTAFDALVTWLTYLEWRRHKLKNGLPSA